MKVMIVNERNLSIVQQNSERSVMALGFFDGLHRGHQAVIAAAKKIAIAQQKPLAVMSFFPHPKTVFANCEIDYLMPMEKKAATLKSLGVDIFYIVEFTKTFAALSPKQFIEQYIVGLQVEHAVAGYDYTYGAKGLGTVHTIHADSNKRVDVCIVEKFALYGEKVSSTCIRQKVKAGKIEEVAALLGRFYEVRYNKHQGVCAYYTLPEPGLYEVTVISGRRAWTQTIHVIDQQTIHFDYELSAEECNIVFRKRIQVAIAEIS